MSAWESRAACRTRPPEWWETGDEGNRLALMFCSMACPVRGRCAADTTDPDPVGVIRAGVAYHPETGRALSICLCGRPVMRVRPTTERCEVCVPVLLNATVERPSSCGTPSGCRRHEKRQERPCWPCREARRVYTAGRRRAAGAERRQHHERTYDAARVRLRLDGQPIRLTSTELHAALGELLNQHGLSDRQIAERAGCSRRSVQRYRKALRESGAARAAESSGAAA